MPFVDDMAAPVSQALGGDVAFQLAQWYSWVSWRAIDRPNVDEIPINVAIRQIYGWTVERVYVVRFDVSLPLHASQYRVTLPNGPVSTEQTSDLAADNDAIESDILWRMTRSATEAQLGHIFLNRKVLIDLFGLHGIHPGTAAESIRHMFRTDALETLRMAVNDRVASSASGACARAIASSPFMPTLMQLNSGLVFVRFDRSGASANVHFQSNAIEWALAQYAAAHPLA